MERRFLRDEEILGADVFNPEGTLLGQIHDLLIDRATGHVRYVIVDFEDFIGDDQIETLYPLPWPMLNYDPGQDQYTANVSAEQLKIAPDYDDESFEDRDWERRIHTHYKIWPYWAY